jgi:hypothetical protein
LRPETSISAADFQLDALGGGFADQGAVGTAHVVDDRFVEAVAADAHRLRVDDAVERDHRDFGGAAADVDDHRAAGLGHRQAGADRGGHRFLDQVHLARTGLLGRFLDRAALHVRRAAGHAHQHARTGLEEARLVHLLDEVLQHFLGVGEVGDHAVLHRSHRGDVAGRAAEHLLGFAADRGDRAVAAVGAIVAHRDHRRFVQDDALAADEDEGVGRAQVDGQVVGKHAAELLEHRMACRWVRRRRGGRRGKAEDFEAGADAAAGPKMPEKPGPGAACPENALG